MLDRLSLTLLSFSAVTLLAVAPAAIGQQSAAARELHRLFADDGPLDGITACKGIRCLQALAESGTTTTASRT